MTRSRRTHKGFSMLEVLLTIAIIGMLAGFSIPIYQSFQVRNDLEVSSNTYVRGVRRAQALSIAMWNDSEWGVHIDSDNVTIFMGNSYASRDPSYDEVFIISAIDSVSGLTEFYFTKKEGLPSTTGTTTITSLTNTTRTVTINEKGVIDH